MLAAEKFMLDFCEDEYQAMILVHTDRDGEKAEKAIDELYEKYLGPEVQSTVVRPFSPSKEFFWSNDPHFLETALRKRDLVAIKKVEYVGKEYFLFYSGNFTYYEGPVVITDLLVVSAKPLQIVARYLIDYNPEPHWWHAAGKEMDLTKLAVLETKTLLDDVAKNTQQFLSDEFLKQKIKSEAR